jgi:hypothetical protein
MSKSKRTLVNREALESILNVARRMSNVCYAGEQDSSLPNTIRVPMSELRREWDKCIESFSKSQQKRPR